MRHEERKRELASKENKPRWFAFTEGWHGVFTYSDPGEKWEPLQVFNNTAEHIAFHDPETALLEAEVIARARDVERAGATGDWGDDPLKYLQRAIAALDAYTSTRTP